MYSSAKLYTTQCQFADSRQAYADLDDATKLEIRDWIVNNSQFQCRRKASNNHPMLMVPEVRLPAKVTANVAH